MQEMWVENYRCFRERQTARLAPLTLLVGDNSTGKTSFLAMVRALDDISRGGRTDFKEAPYDLGSFDEIVHHRGGRAGRANDFRAGFGATHEAVGARTQSLPYRFSVRFGRRGSIPVAQEVHMKTKDAWIVESLDRQVKFGTGGKVWRWTLPQRDIDYEDEDLLGRRWRFDLMLRRLDRTELEPVGHEGALSDEALTAVGNLYRLPYRLPQPSRPFAAAPVRSRPHRTYDPGPFDRDAEGDYVPMYLADAFFRRPKQWEALRRAIENFGRESGLFDEIRIKPLGKRETEPFQVQVRKASPGGAKGPYRNLIDVGYGVSQVLPIMTEFFRPETRPGRRLASRTFLLQQPEVHLHPSAQAALGTLFCELASAGRQLLVETHSDHLMDRVRMDVRDGRTKLKPQHVSILYFERGDLDVRIHSLEIDAEGNIVGAPPGYREFFMEEADRSSRL